MPWHTCGGQRTSYGSVFSPSYMQIIGLNSHGQSRQQGVLLTESSNWSFRKFLLSAFPQLKPQGTGILLHILNSPVWCLSSFLPWQAADLAPTHIVPQPCFFIPTSIARASVPPANPTPCQVSPLWLTQPTWDIGIKALWQQAIQENNELSQIGKEACFTHGVYMAVCPPFPLSHMPMYSACVSIGGLQILAAGHS